MTNKKFTRQEAEHFFADVRKLIEDLKYNSNDLLEYKKRIIEQINKLEKTK